MKWSDILEAHGVAAEKMLAAVRAGEILDPAVEGDVLWRVHCNGTDIVYEEYEWRPEGGEPRVDAEKIEFD